MRLFRRFRKPAAPPASPPPPPQSILLNEGKNSHAERFRFSLCDWLIWNELVFSWVNRRLARFIPCLFLTVTFASNTKQICSSGMKCLFLLSRWMMRVSVPCSSANGWQWSIRQLTFFETWMRVCVLWRDWTSFVSNLLLLFSFLFGWISVYLNSQFDAEEIFCFKSRNDHIDRFSFNYS